MPIRKLTDRSGTAFVDEGTNSFDGATPGLMDAVVTAAALVASADGRIAQDERQCAADFLSANGFPYTFTRDEILAAFDRRVREFQEEGAEASAIDSLERFAGKAPARLIVKAGEEVAAADGRLTAREILMLQVIRITLSAPDSRRIPC